MFRRKRGVKRNRNGFQQQTGEVGDGLFRAILAQDGDAVAASNSPGSEGSGSAGDFLGELARGNRQPFAGLAMEHDSFEISFDGCKKDVIQRADAHREFGVPEETLVCGNCTVF